MPDVLLSLGSNISPETNIQRAVDGLARSLRLVGISTVYRTTPIGRPDQPEFYNAVLATETSIPPRHLKLGILRPIEAELRRVRTEDKYAPRTIDLDITVYGNMVIDEPDLKIPDPDVYERAFLAAGIAELAPDLVLPDSHVHISQVLQRLTRIGLIALQEYTASLRSHINRVACENLHRRP